jgi:hypothetical protein
MRRDIVGNISQQLPIWRRRSIVRELRSHLLEAQQDLESEGWGPEDAAHETVRRFGNPDEVVDGFERVYRPARVKRLALAVSLAVTLLAGAWGGGTFASATSAHRAPSSTPKTSIAHHTSSQPHTCNHAK